MMFAHLRALCLALLSQLVLIVGVAAQNTNVPASEVDVTLTSYAFAPSMISLKANVPVRLHLVNNATKSHNFYAPEFFAASTIAPADKSKVVDGGVDLDDGQTVDLTITPTRSGSYHLECTHFLHAMLGMTAQIKVQ